MLCEVCSRMFSSGVKEGNHHDSLASLTKAAAEGCYICAPLLKYAMKVTGSLEACIDRMGPWAYFHGTIPMLGPPTEFELLRIRMRMRTWEKEIFKYRHFIVAPQAVLPVRANVHGRGSVIPMHECLPVAKEWMSTCLDKHEQCPKHTEPHSYPTRLLELGGPNCRLILPRDHKTLGPYAALSYCWGPNPNFLRLTADNLQEFRVEIPYTSLPIAFQEAILIVKELGIRYLWIDALCIIQSGFGSSEDWQSECGRMQEVYSNCVINLSLAQAAYPNQSCLRGYIFDSTLPFKTKTINRTRDHGSREYRDYTVLSLNYFQEALYDQPISSRAWVMQERLLATRVLSIGHGELFWDCQQVPYASESFPYGFAHCSDHQRGFFKKWMVLSVPFVPHISNDKDLEKTWSKLLEEYTARELTYPEADKLAGISAIATRIGHAMNDKYLSGHFLKMLPRSLVWRVKTFVPSSSRVKKRAHKRLPKSSGQVVDDDWIITPSWSWASMDGQLDMSVIHETSASSIAAMDGYRFSTVGQRGPEAQVESKLLLTIRAWCRGFKWSNYHPINEHVEWVEWSYIRYRVDDVQDLSEHESQCLLAALTCSDSALEGLILRGIDFDGKKVYERIGYFSWDFGESMDQGNCSKVAGGGWKTFFTLGERSITLY